MIEKKTILNRGEIDFETNIIGVRLAKIIVEDGVELSREWHRTSIEPGADIDSQLIAINAHLASMNNAEIDTTEIDRLKAIIPVVQTPEVIAAYRSNQTEQQAKLASASIIAKG